ncbi:protein Aster-B-like isoform X3 [Petromyzon marinus]|uniref:protein Aster-B-like isoform X3 n=1 Tax=Petromyzon marinus TaxID=7757 RepID=UPI003F7239C0
MTAIPEVTVLEAPGERFEPGVSVVLAQSSDLQAARPPWNRSAGHNNTSPLVHACMPHRRFDSSTETIGRASGGTPNCSPTLGRRSLPESRPPTPQLSEPRPPTPQHPADLRPPTPQFDLRPPTPQADCRPPSPQPSPRDLRGGEGRPGTPRPTEAAAADGSGMVEKGSEAAACIADRSPTGSTAGVAAVAAIAAAAAAAAAAASASSTASPGGSDGPGARLSSTSSGSSRSGKGSKKSQSWYNVLSPTYKQRNEDFRKLFKQLPESERLIVDYSCALQRDILLQGRLYLSENWICFYSNIFRWETLLTIRLKEITAMTKEKTARLIPNAIQICTENDKHFFTSLGARDRTFMMMFRLWQNALLDKPLCPKELWQFVHQCYGNELGLTSEDEDYVPPDDDIATMGFVEELVGEDPDLNDSSKATNDSRSNPSPRLYHKYNSFDTLANGDGDDLGSGDGHSERGLGGGDVPMPQTPSPPSLDMNTNEGIPTELSDSSETSDEHAPCEVDCGMGDLSGRVVVNAVFHLGADKLFDLLFHDPEFGRNFAESRKLLDFCVQPWRKEATGHMTRVLTYGVAMSNPLAPKSANGTETQTLYKNSREGECYVVDAEIFTHDIPYQDYFHTAHRYCILRITKHKCRLRVSSEIRYRKQPWGLVKTFIERNTWNGIDDYFRHLESEVGRAEKLLLAVETDKPLGLRRRKRLLHRVGVAAASAASPVTTPTDEDIVDPRRIVPGPRASTGSNTCRVLYDDSRQRRDAGSSPLSRVLLLMAFVLLVLLCLNGVLFYKLWALETTTQNLQLLQSLRRSSRAHVPQSEREWARVIEQQQRAHEAQLGKWREALKLTLSHIDQLRESLARLHRGVHSPDSSTPWRGGDEGS